MEQGVSEIPEKETKRRDLEPIVNKVRSTITEPGECIQPWGTVKPAPMVDAQTDKRIYVEANGDIKYIITSEEGKNTFEDFVSQNRLILEEVIYSQKSFEELKSNFETLYLEAINNRFADKGVKATSVTILLMKLTDSSLLELEPLEETEEETQEEVVTETLVMDANSETEVPQQKIEEEPKIVEPTVIKTDEGAENGQNKCPKCGATDISLNIKTGMLRCNYCRFQFEASKATDDFDDIHSLEGEVLGSGASNITADANDTVTLKCTSCGSEVVIDTASAPHARCHWCRNTLSINQQIPNGAIPDMVLPFKVTKKEAQAAIEEFVKKRNFFANPRFKAEFTTENIMGVYLPYMVIDINAHSKLTGQGEVLVRKYTVGSGDYKKTRYDADLYDVDREFDIFIDDLTIESSSDKLNNNSTSKTNNIINAIMPFDTENCVKWDANFLKGYTSEKRDTNIDDLRGIVELQAQDISRFNANKEASQYNRGIRWDNEQLEVKGQKWKASYLPVWLYSYQQVEKNGNKLLHYVAVNARTKETMGSVPIHMPKLMFMSIIAEIIGILLFAILDFDFDFVFLFTGIAYFIYYFSKYRNQNARHTHEMETKATLENVQKVDKLNQRLTGLSNATMHGANNKRVNGSSNNLNVTDLLKGKSSADQYVKGKMEDYQNQQEKEGK